MCIYTAAVNFTPGLSHGVSNCATKIITGPAPAEFVRVGHHKAYCIDRPCNLMPVSKRYPNWLRLGSLGIWGHHNRPFSNHKLPMK